MKVIYYSILIAATFKAITTEEENDFDRCIYKETCSSEESMGDYEACFEKIPMEDQGPILETVEEKYGFNKTPVYEFIQSACEDSKRGREIFDALYDQIEIAHGNNNPTTNEVNERKYLDVYRSKEQSQKKLVKIELNVSF